MNDFVANTNTAKRFIFKPNTDFNRKLNYAWISIIKTKKYTIL